MRLELSINGVEEKVIEPRTVPVCTRPTFEYRNQKTSFSLLELANIVSSDSERKAAIMSWLFRADKNIEEPESLQIPEITE